MQELLQNVMKKQPESLCLIALSEGEAPAMHMVNLSCYEAAGMLLAMAHWVLEDE